jgi:signal transduction histidine kinase
VTSPGGAVLYQSAEFTSTFVGRDSTGDYVGQLPVQTALRPDIAAILIIGGLPRSRLPLLFGLLALTIALIISALFLLRREQELGRLRSEFVSGVSHELRTPLAQIRMFAETLRLGRVRNEAERQRSLTIVDQEARRLTHLVENLLYFSRSEQQPQRITPGPIALGPLVREVAEGFSSLAAARDMRVEVTPGHEQAAYADADSVRQILLNLFDNAVKYGPAGQTIQVTLGMRDGRASLEVEDEGPGIPEKDRERVWQRFWRLDRDREAGVTGTGIGLAIVRELATLHGGGATVESTARGGARLVVVLGKVVGPESRP